MASGPSLGDDNYADVELIRQLGLKTIAVNNTWEHARFCDVIYAGDGIWWRHHAKHIDIKATRWSLNRSCVNLYHCHYRARVTKNGYNSGANAIELAVNVYKANPVILLGFDCSLKHGKHHHPDHTKTKNPEPERVALWHSQFAQIRKLLGNARVINCSRETELSCFPRADLRETLADFGLLNQPTMQSTIEETNHVHTQVLQNV